MKTNPATTMYVFAAYLTGLGVILLLIPNFLLSLFGLPTTTEVWVRVLGMIVIFLGVYYYQMARENNLRLMQTTVYTRASVLVFFLAFVLLEFVTPPLLIFAFPDLLGAIWTWYAIRTSTAAQPSLRAG